MIPSAKNLPVNMRFETFEEADLLDLPVLQPPGWGDLIPRFRFFIDVPFCFPIKITFFDKMIGIGASICHADSAWLACIVIHPDHRNQGLGTMITRKLMDDLDRRRYQTIFLDATYLGFPVYQKLGFVTELEYVHLKSGEPFSVESGHECLADFNDKFYEEIIILDKRISGEDRQETIKLYLRGAKIFLRNNNLEGFYLPGLSDGLIIAGNEEAGLALMKLRLTTRNFSIFPECNKTALEFVQSLHFNHYRSSKRMRWGREKPWHPQLLFNRISGQLG